MIQFPAKGGGTITLTFNLDEVEEIEAGHVLIFPNYRHQLLMVHHAKRGWELPGGKVEGQERSMAAAIREVYEEAGAILHSICWIGQYRLQSGRRGFYKNIYYAEVMRLDPLPSGFETTQIRLFDKPPTPTGEERFSYILQDEVYPRTVAYIAEHFEPRWRK